MIAVLTTMIGDDIRRGEAFARIEQITLSLGTNASPLHRGPSVIPMESPHQKRLM